MKYYQLTKDLPTFKKGEQFFVNDYGQLISCAHEGVVAYSAHTLKRFPDVLKDWFVEVPAPVRDLKTKTAFEAYMTLHPEDRFFQAVRNFARVYLGDEFSFIYASEKPLDYYNRHYDKFQDTFPFECDAIHEILEEDDD